MMPNEELEDDDSFLDWEHRLETFPFYKHMIAGSIAGVMEHVGMFPFDTIKTHLQASGRKISFLQTAKILYKDEGMLRFWKGAQVIASGCVPAHASYFTVYEYLKKHFQVKNEQYEFLLTGFIGACTTVVHDFFIVPSDVLKQRMQLCCNLTMKQAFRNLINEQGYKGLYRSYPITVMMNIPYASTVVCVNENLKTLVQPHQRANSHFWYFLCAGIAGGIAGVLTNPLDVVKTRLQTQEIKPSCKRLRELWETDPAEIQPKKEVLGQKGKSCEFEVRNVRYTDIFQTIKYVYRHEGISAFGKGMMPRMCINVPSTAMSWGTYELIKSFLNKLSKE